MIDATRPDAPTHPRARTVLRWLLILAYLAAGVLHITNPAPFLSITPDWVPMASLVIALTGMAEIAGAVGLAIPRSAIGWARPAAGMGLALYALCVWPANIHHAILDLGGGSGGPVTGLGWGYHAPRLAFQPVIIWWALWAGEVIDWPFRRRQR